MTADTRDWLLSTALTGLLLMAPGVVTAQSRTPNEPKPGTRADRKEDRAEAQRLRAQIAQDRQRLQADVRQFGKNSPQARADRKQLRADRRALYRVQEDREGDRRIARQRRHRRLG